MEMEGRRIGLPEARVTQGLLPGCVWGFPCAQEPCVPQAQCTHRGVHDFECVCDLPLCVKPDYAESYKVSMKLINFNIFILVGLGIPLKIC